LELLTIKYQNIVDPLIFKLEDNTVLNLHCDRILASYMQPQTLKKTKSIKKMQLCFYLDTSVDNLLLIQLLILKIKFYFSSIEHKASEPDMINFPCD